MDAVGGGELDIRHIHCHARQARQTGPDGACRDGERRADRDDLGERARGAQLQAELLAAETLDLDIPLCPDAAGDGGAEIGRVDLEAWSCSIESRHLIPTESRVVGDRCIRASRQAVQGLLDVDGRRCPVDARVFRPRCIGCQQDGVGGLVAVAPEAESEFLSASAHEREKLCAGRRHKADGIACESRQSLEGSRRRTEAADPIGGGCRIRGGHKGHHQLTRARDRFERANACLDDCCGGRAVEETLRCGHGCKLLGFRAILAEPDFEGLAGNERQLGLLDQLRCRIEQQHASHAVDVVTECGGIKRDGGCTAVWQEPQCGLKGHGGGVAVDNAKLRVAGQRHLHSGAGGGGPQADTIARLAAEDHVLALRPHGRHGR